MNDYPATRTLRYGENAWQVPAFLSYDPNDQDPMSIRNFEVIEGELGFNNHRDLDRALQTLTHVIEVMRQNLCVPQAMAIGCKHGNACGFGLSQKYTTEAMHGMILGDPRALFGGTVVTTFNITEELASMLLHHPSTSPRRMMDMVVAPGFSRQAIELLQRKENRCKLVVNRNLAHTSSIKLDQTPRRVQVRGGELIQPNYTFVLDWSSEEIGRTHFFSQETCGDLSLAWAIGSTSNSNTITLVKDGMLIGNGVGQQDRVGAAELAIKRARDAGHDTKGSVAYSDSFFPALDGPQVLADAGISAILTTSGSIKDQQVIDFCNGRGIGLAMIPDKIGRGFFGH